VSAPGSGSPGGSGGGPGGGPHRGVEDGLFGDGRDEARARSIPGIAYWTAKGAFLHPDRTALVTDEGRRSYRDLESGVLRAAAVLEDLGVGPGDRFGILMLNDPRFLDLLFAAGRVGAVAVTLNWRLTVSELEYQLRDAGVGVLFVGPEQEEAGEELARETGCRMVRVPGEYEGRADALGAGKVPLRPPPMSALPGDDEPVLMVYTSGTTGRPKGALLTHRNLFWNAVNDVLAVGLTWQDVSLTVLPLMHVGGIGLFTLPTLLAGGTVVMTRGFDPEETLALIEKEGVTVMLGVPTIHTMLVRSPAFPEADLSTLRFMYNGGDRCPLEVVERFREKGVAFAGGYGLTETAPTAFLTELDQLKEAAAEPGFAGKPSFGMDARIVDEEGWDVAPGEVGEVVLQGPNLFRKYWARPRDTEDAFQGGWFRTGDLAWWTEEGFTFIAGRKKQMLKSGGENIYPAEVEQALLAHPGVAEAVVIGRAHPKWNEVPFAVVVAEFGVEVDEEELRTFLGERLARFKIPAGFAFVDQIPRTSIGKPDRPLLEQRYGGGPESDGGETGLPGGASPGQAAAERPGDRSDAGEGAP
jgi:fatty-acyl-CoA synthase